LEASDELNLSMSQLSAQLADQDSSVLEELSSRTGLKATYSKKRGQSPKVTVTYSDEDGNSPKVTFDLSVDANRALFAELQYFYTLGSTLEQTARLKQMVDDDVPDLYAISMASVKGVMNKYGHMSPEYAGALHVTDAAVRMLLNKFQSLYPNSLFSQVMLYGSRPAQPDPRPLLEDIQRLLPNQDGVSSMSEYLQYFPSLYIQGARTVDQDTCQTLNRQLNEKFGFSAYCPYNSKESGVAAHAGLKTEELKQDATSAPTDPILPVPSVNAKAKTTKPSSTSSATVGAPVDAPTQEDIARYQIVLWFSIAFALVLLFSTYALAFMSFKKDTLLYSTFNPNWEDRKKR
jgi:hypothetical protein